MKLKNYMEDAVLLCVDNVIKELGGCSCNKCKLDIAALALNNLQPHYVVTEKGEVLKKTMTLAAQFEADIIAATIEATKTVMAKPQH